MIKIRISESELRTHASDLREASGGEPYQTLRELEAQQAELRKALSS